MQGVISLCRKVSFVKQPSNFFSTELKSAFPGETMQAVNESMEGEHYNSAYLFANEANIGEATRSPTMKADDITPSSKLFNLNSPLDAYKHCHNFK